MWPSSAEYRPYLTLAQLDLNSVLDSTLIPTVQWLVEEDEVVSSDTSNELRQLLLKINREYQKIEVAQKKFKIALT